MNTRNRSINKIKLLFAAINNDLDKVKYLISIGTNTNFRDKQGRTPLLLAVSNNSFEVIQHLLKMGCDPLIQNNSGETSVSIAFDKGSNELIKSLLNNCIDINKPVIGGKQDTALHLAVQKRSLEVVKWLLKEKKADVNVLNSYGRTPLHESVRQGVQFVIGNFEITELLIKHAANLTAVDKGEFTFLHLAARDQLPSFTKQCLKYCDKSVINLVSSGYRTALHYLVENSSYCDDEILTEFLNKGADINSRGVPNDLAVKYKRMIKVEMMPFIPECQSWYGWTPIFNLLQNKPHDLITIEFFLKNGAELNIRSKNGDTPLHFIIGKSIDNHYATYEEDDRDYHETIKLLLKYGAKVNTQNWDGDTPLTYAILNNSLNNVKLLLRYDSDLDLKDNDGATPLHVAASRGTTKIVEYLLQSGADINIKDRRGVTPCRTIHKGPYEGFHINAAFRYQVLKLATAKQFVCEENMNLISGDLHGAEEFKKNCEREIEKIKSFKIGENLSLNDILVKEYFHNSRLIEGIRKFGNNDECLFPIYRNLLDIKIERILTIDAILSILPTTSNDLSIIPYICMKNLFRYLRDIDLKNLLKALKYDEEVL